MKYNFKKFCDQYSAIYKFLYYFEEHVANEQEMIDWFDKHLDEDEYFRKFVGVFVEYRHGDPISSDREAAAFAYAVHVQLEDQDATESENYECTFEWDVDEEESSMATEKSRLIPDGWHTVENGSYYVEDGFIVRGMTADGQRTLYPFKPSKHGGYDRYTPRAYYSALRRICWF